MTIELKDVCKVQVVGDQPSHPCGGRQAATLLTRLGSPVELVIDAVPLLASFVLPPRVAPSRRADACRCIPTLTLIVVGRARVAGTALPREVVTSTHEVVHYDLTDLPRTGLRDLCDAFRLGKTGNKTDRLNKFSVDRKGWDSLHAGIRKKHRDGGVTKNTKGPGKKASTKRSTLHRELLFSTGADRMDSTTRPCLPTEGSKDMRTDEEKAVLAWVRPRPTSSPSRALTSLLPQADSFVARNPYKPEVELEDEPSPPDLDTSNVPSSPEGPPTSLEQLQAQLAALTTAIAGGNNTGVAPLPAAVVGAPAPAPAPADRGPGPSDSATATTDTDTTTTTDGPPPTCLAASAPRGQLEYLKLGNGRSLCFSGQSVPDPPCISFAEDIPRLVRT
ncbi:hypothetical protein EDB86DRAFT_3103697 [Lactarius hatsudake]|nr:hypothetical protein EDB86DRAFT_3103697 [Lactarius hatsudake]